MKFSDQIFFYTSTLKSISGVFHIREETEDDEQFLYELFVAAQREASARLGVDMLMILGEALMRSQFDLRESAYRSTHPHAMRTVIMRQSDGAPVGRFIIDWDRDGASYGVDLAVHPAARRGAAGLHALRSWVATTDRFGQTARLHVMPDNPAANLYRRLGFIATDTMAVPIPMHRVPRPVAG